MNISPGLIGLYWLALSVAGTVAWSVTVGAIKWMGRRACPCGTCPR